MAERYEKLFSSYDKYYSVGSPALIVAEAILKDTKENKVKAQLKFQNISSKIIKAVNIGIKAYDSFGRELQGIEEYQYADLCVGQGGYWGQDKAITLPNDLSRTIEVSIHSIIYKDETIWESESKVWNKLSEPKKLYSLLLNDELVKQYKLEYGESAEYVYLEEYGIWHCTCGAINRDSEELCYHCKANRKNIDICDAEKLKADLEDNRNNRIYNEAIIKYESNAYEEIELAEYLFLSISYFKDSDTFVEKCKTKLNELKQAEQEQERIKKIRSVKRNSLITITILLVSVAIIGCFYYINVISPRKYYHEAMKYMQEEEYDKALECLSVISKSKYILENMISQEEINKLKDKCKRHSEYKEALSMIESENYTEAIKLLSNNEFDKGGEQIKKSYINLGIQALDKKEYDKAIDYFKEAGHNGEYLKRVYLELAYREMRNEEYDMAIHYFKLADYKGEDYQEVYYLKGMEAYNSGKYNLATTYFQVFPDYKDSAEMMIKSKVSGNIKDYISDEDKKEMDGYWYKSSEGSGYGYVIAIRITETLRQSSLDLCKEEETKDKNKIIPKYYDRVISNNGDGTYKSQEKGWADDWFIFELSEDSLIVLSASDSCFIETGTYKKIYDN